MNEKNLFCLLLVESDEEQSDLLLKSFEGFADGYSRIEQAFSLSQAREKLLADEYDGVLINLNLPDSHGTATLRELQRVSRKAIFIVYNGASDADEYKSANVQRIDNENTFGINSFMPFGVFAALEKRRESRQQNNLEKLISANPDAAIVIGEDSVVKFVNRAALDLFEKTADEFIGSRLEVSVGENHFAEIELHGKRGVINAEMRVVKFDWDGEPAILASVRDITERRRNEKALREALQFNEQIIKSANEGIVVLDRQLNYLVWNPYLERLMGISADRVIGKNIYEIFPEIKGTVIPDLIGRALSGETSRADDEALFVLGKTYWLSACYSPFYSVGGEITGIIITVSDTSRRREMEDELIEREQMISAINDTAPGVIVLWDLNSDRISYINKSVRQIFGYAPEEIYAADLEYVFAAVHPEDIAELQKFIKKLLKTADGKVLSHECRRKDKNGEWIYVSSYNKVFERDANDRVTKIISVVNDISAQKITEEELLTERARLEKIAHSVPSVIYSFKLSPDKTATYEYISPSFEEVFGVKIQDTLKDIKIMMNLIDPEDAQAMRESIIHSIRTMSPWRFTWRINHPLKGKVWIEGYSTPFREADGSIVWHGMFSDVTARKKAENALRVADEKLNTVIEGLGEGLVITDLSGKVLRWNRAGLAMYNISGEDEQRNSVTDFVDIFEFSTMDGEVIKPENWAMQRIIRGEKIQNLEVRLRRLDTDWERILLYNGALVTDEYGEKTAFLMTADITARKEAEERLGKNEEQLHQSQKLESIGRLAGGIAHDFNNMLTAIIGYSELSLRRLSGADELRHNIEEIKKAADRSADLTRQLLAFSRKQILKPKVLNINRIVTDVSGMLERLIGENIVLETRLNSQIHNVKVDPGQFSQVIVNLVVNARDAIIGDGTIVIATENISQTEDLVGEHFTVSPGEYVSLTVTDTGGGIEGNILPFIFEPFFTTKEIGKGTGLGLATVYGIVKQSGGYIFVSSDIGTGTSFKIYLPGVDESGVIVRRNKPASLKRGVETVLLVEDEAMVRRLSREILELHGYVVIEAENGVEALEICRTRREKIDLLLTDVVMPQMGGRELIGKVKEVQPEIKILLMSGYTNDAEFRQSVGDAEESFLHKPFTLEDLLGKVRQTLGEGEEEKKTAV